MRKAAQDYLDEMKNIQNNILEYLEDDSKTIPPDFKKLFNNNPEFCSDKCNFIELIYLISRISREHHRTSNFYEKITSILQFLKNDITQTFSNHEIFNIFRKDNKILLFLIENKIIEFDKYMYDKISFEHHDYFYPACEPYIYRIGKFEPTQQFLDERNVGENSLYICKLIRSDSVIEFIEYVTKNNITLSSNVEDEVNETNRFLVKKKKFELIEYSAFFGAFQIFQYLMKNDVQLYSSLWLYAIHGNNPFIIHLLEENEIKPEDESYVKCFKEAIKCHHNDLAKYFLINYLPLDIEKTIEMVSYFLKCHNYDFIDLNSIRDNLFVDACQHKYSKLVSFLIHFDEIDVNVKKKTKYGRFSI